MTVGTLVWAWDEITQTTGWYTVTATWGHADSVLVDMALDGAWLMTKPEHPFYTDKGWVAAGDLWLGDHIRAADGSWGVVTRLALRGGPRTMYNLTVAEAHTFFVGDGQWLVHNTCPPINAGDVGRFSELDKARVTGDDLEPHHMPQAALAHTSCLDGGAIALPKDLHQQTRTYGARGRLTAQQDRGRSFRDVLAADIQDLRRIAGNQYDPSIRKLIEYYETNFPQLMRK